MSCLWYSDYEFCQPLSKMSSLPPEIITDLLSRLPVKSLLRFRCVSKRWCAEIDGPEFIKLHLAQSIATSSNLSLVAESDDSDFLYSIDYNLLERVTIIETQFCNPHQVLLQDTCNGLFLLLINDGNFFKPHCFILFNPSTRKHFVLPPPPSYTQYDDVGSVDGTNRLCFDAVNDDYKVFSIVFVLGNANSSIDSEARVYSLKSNSWRMIREFAKGVKYNCMWDAFVNGALHSVDCETSRNVVAFDIGNESFKLLPAPEFSDNDVPIIMTHAFDGCLSFVCRYSDYRTDIWVMKKYGVKESWSMLLSMQGRYCCLDVKPVIYSKNRAEVLLSHDCQKLVWYDLKKKTVRDFRVHGLPFRFDLKVFIESLVSVDSFQKINEKKQQGEEQVKEKKLKKKRDDFLSKGFKLKL